MRRMAWVRLVVLAALAAASGGCGPDPFGAPARSKVKPALPVDPAETARSVYLILPMPLDSYTEAWGQAAQREAAVDNSIFRSLGPPPGGTPMKSSKLVRDAIADGANAIVVVPDDDPDLAKAVEEAQSRKITVALLGRPIPKAEGPNLPPAVSMIALAPFADRLVSTAVDDARRAKLSLDGTALIVDHRAGDPFREDRVEAFRQALGRQGIKKVEVVAVEAKSADPGSTVIDAIKKFPDVFLALADDDEAMQGAVVSRIQTGGKPGFFVAGFVGNWQSSTPGVYLSESAHVELHYENLARVAIRMVLARAQGKDGPLRSFPEPLFYRGEAVTTTSPSTLKPPAPNAPLPPPTGPGKP